MLFSIIIPTCNRNESLKICLDNLYFSLHNLSSNNCEVIVSDDSYSNQSEAFIKDTYSWIQWIKGPKRGPAANRNNGAKHAKGEWLIFLDDDVLPDHQLIESYSNAICEYPSIEAFEGAIHPDDWQLLKLDMSECPVNINGGCFWSANVCIKRELFLMIGGFDENYSIAAQEDQDIYDRIKVYTQVPFITSASVVHPVRVIKMGYKIRRLHLGIINWYKYSIKRNSFWRLILKGYSSQFSSLFYNIQQLKFKSAFCNFYVILIFLPTIYFNRKLLYAPRQN